LNRNIGEGIPGVWRSNVQTDFNEIIRLDLCRACEKVTLAGKAKAANAGPAAKCKRKSQRRLEGRSNRRSPATGVLTRYVRCRVLV